ncbi:hypothetical protein M422DRAFT_32123 [Sphaerobolus stellatus SS14]|uniref:DUF1223 domain-containing protein n=1 Tax=Sphaerobolus stellatus (strain SS14) TaxID=990650 RepID=A0A0C9VQS4_SPHS4|nr:hypothetical protein M422DRAFT_32123 [Sphaerobolus stellatus SS14]
MLTSTIKDLLHLRSRNKMGTDDVCVPKNADIVPSMAMDTTMNDKASSMASTMQSSTSPTVIELFQSQGCSSCPPANDNVIALADDQDKLVLTYEVTYWDYLGWPDTFANKAWDQRQRDYAAAVKTKRVYTPQVIVNGVSAGVGSRKSDLQSLIRSGEAAPLASSASIDVSESRNQITVTGPSNTRGIVQLVLYDPRNQNVAIPRGENTGRNLPYHNIMTDLIVLGSWDGGKMQFPLPEIKLGKGLKAAIVVQGGQGGPIIAAAKI